MERLERLKLLLGLEGGEEDALLYLALEMTEDRLLSYLNQEHLPASLETVLLMLTANLWQAGLLGTAQAPVGAVASVSRGDVTTAFFSPGESGFALGGGDGFFGWRRALNAHRRLRW